MRQRRTEIRIPGPDEAQGLLAQLLGQGVIALAATLRDQPGGPVTRVSGVEPLQACPYAQPQLRGDLFLGQPALLNRAHHVRSLHLAPTHDDEP